VREIFSRNDSLTLVAGTEADITTIIIPPRCKLITKAFGNYNDTPGAWGPLQWWSMRLNGIPISDAYSEMHDQIGYAAQRQPIRQLEFSGGVFTILGHNGTLGAVAMGSSFEYYLEYD
jgi:hypothetical protein